MTSGATSADMTTSVALQGPPTSSSKSLNTSTVDSKISTTLVGTGDQDQGNLDGSSVSGEQVAASKTTTATSEEGSQDKNDVIDANEGEDVDEDSDDDYDDEDGDDSDPDFPKFPDEGRGRIVGPVAGQKPKPRPK